MGILWKKQNKRPKHDSKQEKFKEFFDLKKYDEIHLSGSRGCVRKCTFCNVPLLWPKFTSKTGERIAQELIYYYETFDVKRFVMVDSLVNGNHKVFVNFITILSEYNKN